MSNPRILITEPIPEAVVSKLQRLGDVVVGRKGEFNSETRLKDEIATFDVLLCMLSTPVTERVLEQANRLKIVANFAVGYNNIDVDAASAHNIKVANTPDVLTEACGDFAMGLLMATTRKFFEAEQYLRNGHFEGWEPLGFLGMELRGKKLGIVGMGRIGQAFAHRARAFGMEICYHNRTQLSESLEKELNATYYSDIRELERDCDVLSLNCPLTDETHHLISHESFKRMPNHSILINISRGPVVDEAALAKALHNGSIAGAGLDVFEEEPKVHPELLTAPNCTILPHIASATFETREAIGMLAADAITSFLGGQPADQIPNIINP